MEALDVFILFVWQNVFLEWEMLCERAQEQFDEEEARRIQKKIAKNEFGFDDFLTQIQQVKMGNMKDLVGMIPGASKAMKDVEIEDDAFKHIEAIIHSMTPSERSKPSLIDVKRKARISKVQEQKLSNQLMKQFEQMSKMMKMMQGPGGKTS
jgi:signal recognition particle subunit SRP54